jgi:hypothetical protein
VKEYLTMKEASLLIGKTPKTIKNYIKRGVIKNFFQVEGKYGQEYKISLRDLEPLGITFLDVLREDFSAEAKDRGIGRAIPGEKGPGSPGTDIIPGVGSGTDFDPGPFMARYEEVVMELARCRDRLQHMTVENGKLKQDNEEKDMLIHVLMQKGASTTG